MGDLSRFMDSENRRPPEPKETPEQKASREAGEWARGYEGIDEHGNGHVEGEEGDLPISSESGLGDKKGPEMAPPSFDVG